MQWKSGATDLIFFHTHEGLQRPENSVIDYDIRNIDKVLSKQCGHSGETVAKRSNVHYRESLNHIKRSFGNVMPEDFQKYTWGMVLTTDLGLANEKIEALIQTYCKLCYPRVTLKDFRRILCSHTSYRKITDVQLKRRKWQSLWISFQLFEKKSSYHDIKTITKRLFLNILDLHDVQLDIDIDVLTRDMSASDYEATKIHMLLLEDPIINGVLKPSKSVRREYIRTLNLPVSANRSNPILLDEMLEVLTNKKSSLEQKSMSDSLKHFEGNDESLNEEIETELKQKIAENNSMLQCRELRRQRKLKKGDDSLMMAEISVQQQTPSLSEGNGSNEEPNLPLHHSLDQRNLLASVHNFHFKSIANDFVGQVLAEVIGSMVASESR